MDFSILMPSYNYERYIGTALTSVAAQGCSAEVVVQDGCSNDGTGSVVRNYAIAKFESVPDNGQSHALNLALERAQAPIIGWLNADDFYLPGSFELVSQYFRDNPEVDVVYGDTVLVDEVGRFARLLKAYPPNPHIMKLRGCVIGSTSSFFRKSALSQVDWDENCRVVMDWDLYIGLIDRGANFAYLPIPIGAFRQHAEQVTHAPLDRSSEEHQYVRSKHNLKLGNHSMGRRLGDALHSVAKLRSGAWQAERRCQDLVGMEMLSQGGPDAVAADRLFQRACGRKR